MPPKRSLEKSLNSLDNGEKKTRLAYLEEAMEIAKAKGMNDTVLELSREAEQIHANPRHSTPIHGHGATVRATAMITDEMTIAETIISEVNDAINPMLPKNADDP